MDIIEEKRRLRQKFLHIRKSLSLQRRKEAKCRLVQKILSIASPFKKILSFYSFDSEIETHTLNQELLQINKLALPSVIDEQIVPYDVADMSHFSSYGSMLQPNPQISKEAAVDLVLVPALAFDKSKMRLGWGKGHYDKFLIEKDFYTIGIGFDEQLYEKKLPFETHDIELEELYLF